MTEDAVLAPYLAAATTTQPPLGDDFLARLARDADALQPAAPVVPARQAPRQGLSRLKAFFAGLGGAPALSACAIALVAGFWFGLVPPAAVADALPLWPDSDLDIGFYDEDEILALLEDE